MTDYLDTTSGRRIAYNRLEGEGTGIVFLGGFMSDMAGTTVSVRAPLSMAASGIGPKTRRR